eukprot:TRINITY_DN13152_c0_g1_i1.p2 TRINITY_DN13152_c0_g1~~TRINITY_DN13152_c0_g1_i1.p2  ORF type:complete len:126 (+),score=26.89 TRINITY_DN13152_c0_g1_i1:1170-1547(+)
MTIPSLYNRAKREEAKELLFFSIPCVPRWMKRKSKKNDDTEKTASSSESVSAKTPLTKEEIEIEEAERTVQNAIDQLNQVDLCEEFKTFVMIMLFLFLVFGLVFFFIVYWIETFHTDSTCKSAFF